MSRFTLPRDVYHGKGCLEELKNLKGKKAILVVGGGSMKRQGFLDKAVNYLKEGGMEVELFEGVEPDPSVETVMKGAEAMRKFEPDWIVAMGGGSPIDAAKAMWAFYEYPETTFEDLCIPFNFPELRQKAKFAAIPSTSGTATEVTAFSVITDTARNYKLTVFSYELLPKYALLDPEMIMSVPPSVAASCGIDALIHAWEAYTSLGASPFSDAMAEKAMELIGGNIRRFVANRKDEEAACAMMSGSMFAGIAFAWARLGNVHAMSHPVSAFFNVPHGVANSILLPIGVEYNALADHGRYEKIYNYIREKKEPASDFKPEMLVEEIRKLNADLGIPKTLSEVGVTEDKIPQMAADAMKSGNIAANPRQSTIKDIEMLYHKAM